MSTQMRCRLTMPRLWLFSVRSGASKDSTRQIRQKGNITDMLESIKREIKESRRYVTEVHLQQQDFNDKLLQRVGKIEGCFRSKTQIPSTNIENGLLIGSSLREKSLVTSPTNVRTLTKQEQKSTVLSRRDNERLVSVEPAPSSQICRKIPTEYVSLAALPTITHNLSYNGLGIDKLFYRVGHCRGNL